MWTALAAALAVGVPTATLAQDRECGDVAALVRQAYPTATPDGEQRLRVGGRTLTLPSESSINPHALICRRWRGRPGLLLVAVPLIAQVRPDSTEGGLELLVVDEASGKPRHRRFVPRAMDDDAVRLSGLSFDTAAWTLGPDRLAFGVRREWTGSSRPNPFSETTLSLYEVRGGMVTPVLQDLMVQRSQGEWDTTCAGETLSTERILRMVPGRSGQDISVLERRTRSTSRPDPDGDCRTTDRPEPSRTVRLPFDGSRYAVPAALSRD